MSPYRHIALPRLLWLLSALPLAPTAMAQAAPEAPALLESEKTAQPEEKAQLQETDMEKAARLLQEGRQMYAQDNMFEAMPLLQEAAELGLPEAQGFWGFVLQKGGTTDAALEMYRKGADGGDAFAKLQLAGFLLRGDFLPQDVEQGFAMVNECIAKEYAPAMVVLGNIQAEGQFGIAKDEVKALELLERAAELNDINALTRLHLIYRDGLLGQAADPVKAAAYAEKSSQLQAIKGNSP
ncbi:tetratricopeptide repeat protein [Shewanella cyperi]|uniref:tetratricopeptide repeat protein n=1 Tax=Shewanella cyperi TaxID=2814292 RepID=UPI001A94C117|nr:SEL1-like repeat protein [Shewanella cyperi]QSX41288.1 sel1 repeat family protein [Shewanella cyperi]